jgi:MFS family permease
MTAAPSTWAPATRRTGRSDRGQVAFWLVARGLGITMLGTTLPTPLYVIYQGQWHFSAVIVTLTFAVYAVAVLATLLLAGRSSDQAGRRPVLAVALGASALSTVAFILAPDVGVLFAGRILSGVSAGLMTGTATAALAGLIPASASRRASLVATAANMGGLGLGPLIAGLFAQYAPNPTVLVFEVYLGVLAVAGLCLLVVPETVLPRRRPALRFAGLGIPERGRSEFIAAGAAGFAAFALLGLFAALAPTFLGSVLHQNNHAVQGGVVFLLLAVGAITQVALFRFNSRRVVLAGLGVFLVALALIVAALDEASMALLLAGTAVGGVAVGSVFLGSLATAKPPGAARAARPGHLRLLRRVLHRPDHPGGRRMGGVGVHQRLRGRAGTVGRAGRPVPALTRPHQPRPVSGAPDITRRAAGRSDASPARRARVRRR